MGIRAPGRVPLRLPRVGGAKAPNDRRGEGGVHSHTTLVVAHLLEVRPQGSIDFRGTFPPVFGSTSLDRGLSEWHPEGCFVGTSARSFFYRF